ncbi:pentapeptide repeat-containing protein [Frankia nepalensis]|uniref:pentapeptide repeat-containing protein n=1 Tax=Frankia nepalensis TaxID=1836974 RepID=UPI0027DD7CFE|nr:pentapeptide repeat-containing protein [Frankia nepalensis]
MAGLAGLGAVAAVVAIWHLPAWMYPAAGDAEARATLQGGLLTATAALTAVAGGLIALDETRQANAETKRANEAADVRERAANANTHVREFYATAISLLGSDTLDVRLGGLYALERIAVDSPADHRIVVEVLSAFVREHARPPESDPAGTPPPPIPAQDRPPATDVQTALSVLGRLPTREGIPRADLADAHLPASRLDGANLSGARLSRTNLAGSTLLGTNLSGARLHSANLTGVWLADADLTEADLCWTDLTHANLHGVDLTGARLDGESPWHGPAVVTSEQVAEAKGNADTALPPGVDRPTEWTQP